MFLRDPSQLLEYYKLHITKDFNSFFEELLEKDNSVTIHHRNLQKLATEMYKRNFSENDAGHF